jgi:hypothetical protein
MKRLARKVIGVIAAFTWMGGCASIVGIEELTFDGGAQVSESCKAYCAKMAQACKGPNAMYSSPEACLGVCAKLPPGDILEPFDNSVACRMKEAQLAIDTSEPETHCLAAGPGGAPNCGKNCDSWCTVLQKACPTEFGFMPDCPRACSALKDRGAFELMTDHDGDTIQCRLEHVSNAASSAAAPATHCKHAALAAQEYCQAPQDKAPDCAEFCRFNMAACTGDLAVYESNKQCMAVCMALEPGQNSHREENTMGCRSWHTFNALIDPASHCAHTGPGGDGHCGVDTPDKFGNCVSYCAIAETACGAVFTAKYTSQTACQVDCTTQPEAFGAKHDSKYKLAAAQTGNTLQCRLLHASRALSDATECASALGLGVCQ